MTTTLNEMTEKVEATADEKPDYFINKKEMLARVGASYPTIWAAMVSGAFPRSRELFGNGGKPYWSALEISSWIASRPVRRLKGDKP
jgi:predicted DNA-binding transcriptional regulator AlpA